MNNSVVVNKNFFDEPVECNEHHGPETSEATHHADETTDFAQNKSLHVEIFSIYGTQENKHVNDHHAEITKCQVHKKHVMKLSQFLFEQNQGDY